MPAWHEMQSASGFPLHEAHPCIVLYVPALHGRQDPASGPKYPGLQEQSARLLEPAEEFMFCEQLFCSPSTQ